MLTKILEIVNAAYNDGASRINENIPPDERGDGLATFIRDEILDVTYHNYSDMTKNLDSSIQAMRRARDQLQDVIDALEQAAYDNV